MGMVQRLDEMTNPSNPASQPGVSAATSRT
jgi:hypothetical protein